MSRLDEASPETTGAMGPTTRDNSHHQGEGLPLLSKDLHQPRKGLTIESTAAAQGLP